VNASADDAPTWIFARDPSTIAVQRLPMLRLRVVSSAGHTREFDFKDMSELTAFHCGFEAHLIRTGWSLVSFGPERRQSIQHRPWWRRWRPERRGYPLSGWRPEPASRL
jgi:hypothetical protein